MESEPAAQSPFLIRNSWFLAVLGLRAAALLLGRVEAVDLQKVQLHRSGPSEDRDHDLERAAVDVDLFDDAGEIRERTVDDPHVLAVLVNVLRLRLLFGSDDLG